MLFAFSYIRYISFAFLAVTLGSISANTTAASSREEQELTCLLRTYKSFKAPDVTDLAPLATHMNEMRTSFARTNVTNRIYVGSMYYNQENRDILKTANNAKDTQISLENFNKGKLWSKLAALRAISSEKTGELEYNVDVLIDNLPRTGIFQTLPFILIDSVTRLAEAISTSKFDIKTYEFLATELSQRGQKGREALNKIAHNQYTSKQFDRAALIYRFVLAAYNNRSLNTEEQRKISRRRGVALAQLKQWKEALKENYELIPTDKLTVADLVNMGSAYAKTKEYAKAVNHYTWALTKATKYTKKPRLTDKNKWDIYKWRGYSLSKLDRCKEALEKNFNLIPDDKRDPKTQEWISTAESKLTAN